MRRFLLIALCAAAVSPAASAQVLARFVNPTVEVKMTHPPGTPIELRRAAFVAAGAGCTEELLQRGIELFLRQSVEVLDRQHFDAVLSEHDFAASGYVDPASVAALGKILGPTVLVVVSAPTCEFDHSRDSNVIRTKKGTYYSYTSKTTGVLRGYVRVIDLESGRIFTAQTVQQEHSLAATDDDGYPSYPPDHEVLHTMLERATWEIHKLFFSWDEVRELYFFNDDECGLREAYKLLKIGDVAGARESSLWAVEQCRQSAPKPKFLARAIYNLGMTHLLESQYEPALELLQEAYRLDGGSIIADSIQQCRRAQGLATAMARLEEHAELSLVAASAAAAPAAAGLEPPPDSIEARLQRLEELHQKGLLSQAEYEEKRARVLEDL